MPAYSGGNRWVGIVSLAEPETAPSLAQMAGAAAVGAVKVREGLWVDVESLRRALLLQRKAIEKRQRRDRVAKRPVRDLDRLQVLDQALADLDAPKPNISARTREVLLAQIGFVLPPERNLRLAAPTPEDKFIDLGEGCRIKPDDVRQMVRALGRTYHVSNMESKAAEARQVVKQLRKGDPVVLANWLRDDLRQGLGL